jgi:hypothetical protein
MGDKFFDLYLDVVKRYPEIKYKDCYEMAEKWHKNKFGKRRYKNLAVFKNKLYPYLKKQKI